MHTATPAPNPVTDDQIEIIKAALALVTGCPSGEGTVTITIRQGHIAYITPAPSLGIGQRGIDETRRWLDWDRWERHT